MFTDQPLSRLSVSAKARAVKAHSPMTEKLALEQMRSNLLKDIEKFNKKLPTYMAPGTLSVALALTPDLSSMGMEWDTLDEQDARGVSSNPEAGPSSGFERTPGSGLTNPGSSEQDPTPTVVPERLRIALPSSLGLQFCKTHGLMDLVETERQLREGQMNDSLHNVRVSVGYKSFLFRHGVRKATSYRQRLRSFDDVHLADANVLSNARVYTTARSACLALYDERDESDAPGFSRVQDRYRVLAKPDLKANTAIIEQGVRGVRKLHLPWFWSMDVGGDSDDSEWMAESESHRVSLLSLLTNRAQCTAWYGCEHMLGSFAGRRRW